ncbi:methyltransferase [Pseudonocardia hispaniensis]|uniref:Methyltransferase n=1 Tax=Pseudonocardia hispaniensis TaxID=904933 RepID=A0ABW1J1V2_9PSEU
MLPRLSSGLAHRLRGLFLDHGYTIGGVHALLGSQAHAALSRGEPEAAFRATRGGGELGVLVRLLLLGGAEPEPAVAAALGRPSDLVAAGLLRETADGLVAALDVRPYGEDAGDDNAPGGDAWWVVSDLDAPSARQDRDHVTGVGGASLSLATATVRRRVGGVLDLGTGCGVQALHASRHADVVVATDIAPRALAMAAATFALSAVEVELLAGRWLEPVADRKFDQIVSNPPFVPGPARVDYVYRDSGQAGDAALAVLLGTLSSRLVPGGIAQLLGSWLHVRGQSWPDRVRDWLPPGCDAWILQREVVDPAMHVGTWQRDAGLDLGSPQARALASDWLDWLERERVEAIGFGHILLRRTDATPTVVVEDLPGELADPLGVEAAGWLDRVEWLRLHRSDEALLGARLALTPTAVLERYSTPGGDTGWADAGATLVRGDGPRWRHEVDEPAAALLAGCRGELPLSELIALLSFALDRPYDAMVAATLPAVREFVRHGVLLPVDGCGPVSA